MTDTEIIKALDEHSHRNGNKYVREVCKNALDLIKRLKAENERLVNIPPKDPMDFCGVVCNYAEELIEKAKSEAVKEFAERLKENLHYCEVIVGENGKFGYPSEDINECIDNTAKEMG